MRPILVELPSKLLFVVAIVWAIVAFVLDLREWRKDPQQPRSSTPLVLLLIALGLMGLRGGTWLPGPAAFDHPWLTVPVRSYGVLLGLSFIVGWFVTLRLGQNDGIPQEVSGRIYMWSSVYSIIGARVLYSIVQFRDFASPLDVFKFWEGGMVAYGGMIGGFLAAWYNCWRLGVPLLRFADVSAPAVVLGTAITRVGCLLFGCDYGKRTDLAWAIQFPKGSPAWRDHVENFQLPPDALSSYPVHPTQLYEMLVGLFLFGLLMFLRRVRPFSGVVFLGWVIGYGILRPIIEAMRDDDQRGSVGPLSTSQFIGLTSVLLGLALLVSLIRRYRRDPEALRLWQKPLELAPAGQAAVEAETAKGAPGAKRAPARRKTR